MTSYLVPMRLGISAVCVVLLVSFNGNGFVAAQESQSEAAERTNAGQAQSLTLPFGNIGLSDQITIEGSQSETTISVPIPEGTTPETLTTVVSISGRADQGEVEISSDGQSLETISFSSTEQELAIDLANVEIEEGLIPLTFSMIVIEPETEEVLCRDPITATVQFDDLTITIAGTPEDPETLDQFWPVFLQELFVVLPSQPTDPQIEAAARLGAHATLQARGTDLPITIVNDRAEIEETIESDRPFVRVIEIVAESELPQPEIEILSEDDADTTGLVDLQIRSSDTQLADAVEALTAFAPLLPPETMTSVVEQRQPVLVSVPENLDDLGLRDARLEGTGTITKSFLISQATFGQSVRSMQMEIVGRNSVIRGENQATIQIYVNDQLLGSDQLDDSGEFSIPVTVEPRLMQRDNELKIEVIYTAPSTSCIQDEQPIVVMIDETQSSVVPTFGQAVAPGFGIAPQAFLPSFALVVPEAADADRVAQINAAVQLVGLMQRLSIVPMRPQVQDLSSAIESKQPIVLVQANDQTPEGISAPFDLQSYRVSDADGAVVAEFAVSTNYTVVQAFEDRNRDMSPTILFTTSISAADQTALLDSLITQDGWYSLNGDLYLQTEAGQVISAQIQDANAAELRRQQPVIADAVDTSPDAIVRRIFFFSIAIAVATIVIGGVFYFKRRLKQKKK